MKIVRTLALAGALAAAAVVAAPASPALAGEQLCESVYFETTETPPFPFGSCLPDPIAAKVCVTVPVGPTGPYAVHVIVQVCAPSPV